MFALIGGDDSIYTDGRWVQDQVGQISVDGAVCSCTDAADFYTSKTRTYLLCHRSDNAAVDLKPFRTHRILG